MSLKLALAVTLVVIAVIALAGCGGGTKHSDPFSGFINNPAVMHKWCADYNNLLNTSGWTDKQIYHQLQDTGSINGLRYSTFVAQVRWCFNH